MSLTEKLQTLWKNKSQIAEGFYNTYVSMSSEIEAEGNRRLEICRSNVCGLYDKDGSSEKAFKKGEESCGGCGCLINIKKNCMSCSCYLKDIGQTPLWEAVMTEEQQKEVDAIAYKKQFEK